MAFKIVTLLWSSFIVTSLTWASPLLREQSNGGEQKRAVFANYTIDANPFVEQLLERARPLIRQNLEPVDLPEYSYKITQSVIITEVSAEAKLHDGQLTGLSTLHRAGDAILSTSDDGTIHRIDAHLGVSNLDGFYRGEVTFMSLGPSMSVQLTVETLTVKVGVVQAISGTAKTPPVLVTFDIETLGKIDFEFDGLGPLDWIINPLSNFMLNKISGVIAWIVESPLHSLIADLVPSIKMISK